ncbi:hypothetical protein J6590_039789 [Homalodisca vitripennis]|nr:hypothetical protein J6590_039789 [Homalodisca vitripennis]
MALLNAYILYAPNTDNPLSRKIITSKYKITLLNKYIQDQLEMVSTTWCDSLASNFVCA